jgi:hypothetical protein
MVLLAAFKDYTQHKVNLRIIILYTITLKKSAIKKITNTFDIMILINIIDISLNLSFEFWPNFVFLWFIRYIAPDILKTLKLYVVLEKNSPSKDSKFYLHYWFLDIIHTSYFRQVERRNSYPRPPQHTQESWDIPEHWGRLPMWACSQT